MIDNELTVEQVIMKGKSVCDVVIKFYLYEGKYYHILTMVNSFGECRIVPDINKRPTMLTAEERALFNLNNSEEIK